MENRPNWILIRNVILKAALLFVLLNLWFAAAYPRDLLGSISAYNLVFPGRTRLPHSDVPEKAFNITTLNLEAMLHAHEISAAKKDEFRVVILGDSSVWGFLQQPDQTFTAKLDAKSFKSADGRYVRFYNLGYPTLSVTKDFLLLDRVLRYDPDMIIWFVTLESLVDVSQLESPLLSLNATQLQRLMSEYELGNMIGTEQLEPASFLDRTIVGSREELSELIRLQLYGFAWAATGVDHYIPETYNERREDLSSELEYKGYRKGSFSEHNLYFDAVKAGFEAANGIPLLIVNEPIFVSTGENSDLRYNFFYPRWAYDEYRSILEEMARQNAWRLIDIWDEVPAGEFTNSAIHYSERGSEKVANLLASYLKDEFDFEQSVR